MEQENRISGRGSALLRGALLAVAWCLWGATASATHERATLISWAPAGGNTVEFEIQGSWRRSAYTTGNGGCRDPGSPTLASIACTGPGGQAGTGDVIVEQLGGTVFNPGDGSGTIGSPLGPLLYLVTAIDAPNDWLFGEAIDPNALPAVDEAIAHTYPSTGNFIAFIDDCCRLSITATNAHINNPDGSYRIETIVNVGSGNSPPASAMPPIVLCPINGVCAFTVPASDPDLDTVRFRLSTSAEASGTPPGFVQPGPPNAPNAASVNSSTGLYTWNTTGATLGSGAANTIYSTQVTIEDRDGGNNVKSKIAVDFLIQLVAQAGVPPVFDQPPTPTCGSTLNATVGSNLSFTVQASDTDFGQTVTLNGVGLPVGATMTPPLPTTGDPVSSVFNWTPTGGQVGLQVITFSATDSASLQTLCSITIDVAAPPTPTASRTATSTVTSTATSTATETHTGTATHTVAIPNTATATHTVAVPNTATATPTVTATATTTGTPTTTLTPSITPTPSATRTPIEVDNTLVLNKTKLRFDNSSARDNGKAVMRALLDDNDTSGGLETSLLAGTVIVRVLDSDQFDATFTISGCIVKGNSGIIACKSADKRVKAIFKPTAQGPFVYNMLAVAKRLAATATGAQQPEGPLVYVLMDQGGHPRSDDIGSINLCQAAGTKGLKCREK